MELAGYLAVARRWWTTLLIATWVAGLAGYLIASGVPPTYEGEVRLIVGPAVGDVDVMRAAASVGNTYAELAVAEPALEEARTALGLPAELEPVARATNNETTRILAIRAEHGDPEVAAAIANTLADNLIAREAGGILLPEGELEVVQRATPNEVPIAPQVTLIAIIAAGTGLLAAAVLVLLVEYFGNTINSPRELSQVATVPFLGFAALGHRFRPTRDVPTIVEGLPESRSAATVRMIATKIAYANPGEPTASALIVGSARHDGSADLAAGVATVLARSGRRVLLLDANDEHGELSDLMGIDGDMGLSELLDDPTLDLERLALARPRGPLVLGRGRSSQVDLVDPELAASLLKKLQEAYEVVVITAAPIHLSGNALVWARSVQDVVLVAERDRAKRDDVSYALENLAAVRATVLGTVLLDHPPRLRRRGRRQPARPRVEPRPARGPASGAPDAPRYGASPAQRPPPPVTDPARTPRRSDELGH